MHQSPAHLDKKLDNKCIEVLKEWYKKDYQFLDYCKKINTL